MASPTLADVQLPPRPTLSSLPLELKARIVELGYEQDRSFSKRSRACSGPERELGKLLALFLVNKEFRDLAAGRLFNTLKASRSRDGAFMFSASSRHARHFKDVHLDKDAKLEDVTSSLSGTPFFPNLQDLAVSRHAATMLLGDSLSLHVSTPDGLDDIRTAFRRCALRNTRLTIEKGFGAAEAAKILDAFPFLEKLSLAGARVFSGQTAADSVQLVEAVLRCERLQRLELNQWDGGPGHSLDAAWTTADWGSLESLESLQILTKSLTESNWAFVALLAEHLQFLRLSFRTTCPLPDLSSSPFRRLRHLQISSHSNVTTSEVLSKFADSSLQSVALGMHDLSDDALFDTLHPALEQHSTLRHLSIYPWVSLPASSIATSHLRLYAKTAGSPLSCSTLKARTTPSRRSTRTRNRRKRRGGIVLELCAARSTRCRSLASLSRRERG